MHQTSNAGDILKATELLARERGLARVSTIRLNLAAWADLDPDEVRDEVLHAAQGTLAEGARIEIEVIDPHGRCADCGADFDPKTAALRCLACGSVRVRLEQDRQVTVASVE